MSACSKYTKRFERAMEYNNLPVPKELISTITKRAKSDGQIDIIIHSILDVLEPPACSKSHCPHFTTYGFANCAKGLVPGKCPLNLKYKKDKRGKEDKMTAEMVDYYVTKNKVSKSDAEGKVAKIIKSVGGINRCYKLFKKQCT